MVKRTDKIKRLKKTTWNIMDIHIYNLHESFIIRDYSVYWQKKVHLINKFKF